MTWTYGNDPENSERDAVRLLVGDTNTNDQLVTDEEVQYALSQSRTVPGAAAFTCRAIAAIFARDVDLDMSGASYSESQRVEHYRDLADRLDRMAMTSPLRSGAATPAPVATGLRRSDVRTARDDSDRVRPQFRQGMFDNPQDAGVRDDADYRR